MLILHQRVNKYPFRLHQTQFREFPGVKMIGIIHTIIMAEYSRDWSQRCITTNQDILPSILKSMELNPIHMQTI